MLVPWYEFSNWFRPIMNTKKIIIGIIRRFWDFSGMWQYQSLSVQMVISEENERKTWVVIHDDYDNNYHHLNRFHVIECFCKIFHVSFDNRSAPMPPIAVDFLYYNTMNNVWQFMTMYDNLSSQCTSRKIYGYLTYQGSGKILSNFARLV